MIPGAGRAGLPSSSSSPAAGPSPAVPSLGRDACEGCGAALDVDLINAGTFADPDWRPSRLCMKCSLAESSARSDGPDAADLYDAPPSVREAEPESSVSLGAHSKETTMPTTTLRAYLCTKATCGMMGIDLAAWSAEHSQAVLILPASWLLDPAGAPEKYRVYAQHDRKKALATAGIRELAFPIMFAEDEDPKSETRVIRETDWLAFTKE